MAFDLVTVPCRTDNYAFLLHDQASGRTALVDAPEAAPIAAELDRRGWSLDEIWLTHHHDDHVAGIADLRARDGATVIGHAADAGRLPPLDRAVGDGETFDFAGHAVHVMDVSGHTEGTMEQMWESLSRLVALPPETRVCSGHEYTAANARFAVTIEPANAALARRAKETEAANAAGEPTVPSRLSVELDTNPFLRAGLQEVKENLSMTGRSDADVFAEIRRRKDRF